MASRSTEQSRREAHDELVRAVAQLGWPEEFGEVMAAELGSENAMRRMATYLRRAEPRTPEEAADEMLVIIEQRLRWVERKMSEHANDALTAFYNRPRDPEDE